MELFHWLHFGSGPVFLKQNIMLLTKQLQKKTYCSSSSLKIAESTYRILNRDFCCCCSKTLKQWESCCCYLWICLFWLWKKNHCSPLFAWWENVCFKLFWDDTILATRMRLGIKNWRDSNNGLVLFRLINSAEKIKTSISPFSVAIDSSYNGNMIFFPLFVFHIFD